MKTMAPLVKRASCRGCPFVFVFFNCFPTGSALRKISCDVLIEIVPFSIVGSRILLLMRRKTTSLRLVVAMAGIIISAACKQPPREPLNTHAESQDYSDQFDDGT